MYYLSYKNLKTEADRCGFDITPSRILLYYIIMVVCCVAVSIPFKLNPVSAFAIAVAGTCCLPIALVSFYRKRFEDARYVEVSIYMAQMLSAFTITPKILSALKSTRDSMEEGPMMNAINEAIDHILHRQYSTGDTREEALEIIEKRYSCKRIRTLHRFFNNVEKKGGEYQQTADLLQKDRELWETRVEEFMAEQKSKKNEATASAVVIVAVCWFIMMLSSMEQLHINMASSPVYQIGTTIMLIAEMLIYVKINCSLNIDLLQKVSMRSEKKILDDYHKVAGYDQARENKRSAKRLIIPAVVLLFSLLFKNVPGMCVAGVIAFWAIFDKRVEYAMIVKTLKHEIEFAFPQWLMEMALLLQGNNVRNSIRLTLENASPVLKEPLEKLVAELDKNPDSKQPYQEFLVPLRNKAINSSMNTLYAVSTGTNGDSDTRIKEIINRTIKMTDKAEKMENEDALLGLDIMFSAPVVPGSLAILLYTVIIIMETLTGHVFQI